MTIFNCPIPAAHYKYYDDEWRTRTFKCPQCGWEGMYEEMDGPNLFNELFDCECLKCDKILLIVTYPTMNETIEAAALGNEHAKRELGTRSGEGEYFEEFKKEVEEVNQELRAGWDTFDGDKALIG